MGKQQIIIETNETNPIFEEKHNKIYRKEVTITGESNLIESVSNKKYVSNLLRALEEKLQELQEFKEVTITIKVNKKVDHCSNIQIFDGSEEVVWNDDESSLLTCSPENAVDDWEW
eukprot:gene3221-5536_t